MDNSINDLLTLQRNLNNKLSEISEKVNENNHNYKLKLSLGKLDIPSKTVDSSIVSLCLNIALKSNLDETKGVQVYKKILNLP